MVGIFPYRCPIFVLLASGAAILLLMIRVHPYRYRAAAALWELDFDELEITRWAGEGGSCEGTGPPGCVWGKEGAC